MCNIKFKSFVLIFFVCCIFISVNTIFANSISEETKQSIEEKAKELLENKNGEIDITKIVTEYEKPLDNNYIQKFDYVKISNKSFSENIKRSLLSF